ncbi:uncharacterized protein isoform X1 [Leptinotarsa decemlineata]|uniref:uncharacterized protein isoform X1 n=1 Tax=Leptinotarsa decemlineata TaxID=7539 RepID=UPI003D308E1A
MEIESDAILSAKEDDGEVKKSNSVTCRTCLLNRNKEKCSVMKEFLHGETIRQMVIRCVPEMSDTITNDNHICDKCLKCLLKCYKFIMACLDVESKIREGKVTLKSEKPNETDEDSKKGMNGKKPEIVTKRKGNSPQFKMDDSNKEKTKAKVLSSSSDSQKNSINQNDVDVRSKRRRKTKMIEDSAAEEDIEAYLAEEQNNSSSEVEKSVRTVTKRQSKAEKTNNNGIERKMSKLKKKFKQTEKEKSPEMKIIDKTLGVVAKTYQRKRISVNKEEIEGVQALAQSRSIERIGGDIETPPKINLRTYERKRKLSAVENQLFKGENEIFEKVIMEFDMSSENIPQADLNICENIMNESNDCENEINVDHDYIVRTESEKFSVSVVEQEVSGTQESEDWQEQTCRNEDTMELKCPSCQTHYKTSRGLRDHLKTFHNISEEDYIYHCQVCEEEFKNSEDMLEHRNSHGWCCSLCAEIFSSDQELNSHNKNHPQSYTCNQCSDTFPSKSIMKQHQSMHKIISDLKQRKKKSPQKRYHCDSCSMVFRYPTRLRVHRNIVHLKLKNYKCHDCGKKFGTKNTLLLHHRVKHQDQNPFHCDVCGDSFKRKDYLKKHSSVHHYEQQQFILSTLDETSRANMPLQLYGIPRKHKTGSKKPLNTYTKVRKYTCGVCGLKFFHQRTKFIHERSHNVDLDKKFICVYCWKRFGTKEGLDEHNKRHLKISKNYKCKLCSMIFNRNILLQNHILEVHTSEDIQKRESNIPVSVDI